MIDSYKEEFNETKDEVIYEGVIASEDYPTRRDDFNVLTRIHYAYIRRLPIGSPVTFTLLSDPDLLRTESGSLSIEAISNKSSKTYFTEHVTSPFSLKPVTSGGIQIAYAGTSSFPVFLLKFKGIVCVENLLHHYVIIYKLTLHSVKACQ